MQTGIIIPIEKEQINLKSKYLIKTSKHSIQGLKETVEIDVEEFTSNI